LPLLHEVELLPHQLKTALTVLRRFRGRALLCDEVGLGKTIEAGMILLELLMRKLARRVLILTPSSLVEQWRGEMTRKFGLDFITYDDPLFKERGSAAWSSFDRILAFREEHAVPASRVGRPGHPSRPPTDPDVRVYASGSSDHGFAARANAECTMRGGGSGYRSSSRCMRSHVMPAFCERRLSHVRHAPLTSCQK